MTSKKVHRTVKKRVIARTYDEAICVLLRRALRGFDIIRLLRYLAMTMMFDFLAPLFIMVCVAHTMTSEHGASMPVFRAARVYPPRNLRFRHHHVPPPHPLAPESIQSAVRNQPISP